MTTINAQTSLRTLATIARDTYYSDIPDLNMLIDYFRSERMIAHDDTIMTRTDLFHAIDDDIHDLIHNANLSELIPAADELSDDDYDALARRIDDTRFTAILTLRILDNPNLDLR